MLLSELDSFDSGSDWVAEQKLRIADHTSSEDESVSPRKLKMDVTGIAKSESECLSLEKVFNLVNKRLDREGLILEVSGMRARSTHGVRS